MSRFSPPRRKQLILSTSSSRQTTVQTTLSNRSFILSKPPKANGSRAVTGVVTSLITSHGSILFISRGTTTLRIIGGQLRSIKLNRFILRLRSRGTAQGRISQTLKRTLSLQPRTQNRVDRDRHGHLRAIHRRLAQRTARVGHPHRPLKTALRSRVNHITLLSRLASAPHYTGSLKSLSPRMFKSLVTTTTRLRES